MARIPRLMIYYKGERLVTIHVFSLPAPELAVAFSDDYTSCIVDVANRDAHTVYHYTLDGSEPDETSPVLSGAILFDDEFTINVKAYRTGEESTIYSVEVVRTATPVTTLTSTEDGGKVSIACDTDGARIEYGIKPPTVTLHNMVTVDTSGWTVASLTSVGRILVDSVKAGQKLYFKIKMRVPPKHEVADWRNIALRTSFGIDYSHRFGIWGQSGFSGEITSFAIGVFFTVPDDYAYDYMYMMPFMIDYTISNAGLDCEVIEAVLIDCTELYKTFPSFAALSNAEQKAILETLPYFFGDMTLGGELRNFNLDNPAANSYAALGKYSEENGERIFKLDKTLPDSRFVLYNKSTDFKSDTYFYLRSTYKTSNQVNFKYYNFCGLEYGRNIVGSGFFSQNLSTIPLEWKTNSMVGRRNSTPNNNFQFLFVDRGYGLWPEGETAEVRFKETMLINLTVHGHYTLWRLMGLDDTAIRTMLDALPFFEDSYQGDVVLWQDYVEPFEIDGPRTILARAYKDGMFVSDVVSTTFERVAMPLIEVDWTEEEA